MKAQSRDVAPSMTVQGSFPEEAVSELKAEEQVELSQDWMGMGEW